MQNHLREILSALADAGVEFVVAGGVAVVLHGVERLTLDLDLAIEMTPENLDRFLRTMRKLRLIPRIPVVAESLANPEVLRKMIEDKGALVFSFIDNDKPIRQVDVFLTKDLSYQRLSRDAVKIRVGKRKFQVASIDRLLEIKKSIREPREKDMIDIRELTRLKRTKTHKS